ncbi:MAG TPA: DegT/DnrJ/EryC1/StrS family aminotransferase, partial [Planctomycetota bacterium]|nr:DegT/DnrJ/EryC1/StrS family aminotransferase [Planctomycetota bacterium]
THTYHQFTIETPKRDELADFLGKRGIGCGVYYPVPLHLQECFSSLGHRRGDFPRAEAAAGRVLSLPIHGRLQEAQLERVAGAIAEFFARPR